MCKSDVHHTHCGLPPKNPSDGRCISRKDPRCASKDNAQLATAGIRVGSKSLRIWCGSCARQEWTARSTPSELRVSQFVFCGCPVSSMASFGVERGKPTHCAACKTPGMRDVISRMCDGCGKTRPAFGLKDGKPTHCAICKTPGMRDVISRMCDGCGNTHAAFGIEDGKPTHCATCKTPGMRNVFSRMCVGCGKTQPSFGIEDGKPTHCATCKTPDMRDVRNKMCAGCGETLPVFGIEDGKPTHCSKCKTAVMRDVHNNKCDRDGCRKRANSGTTGNPSAFCAAHALEYWIEHKTPLPNRVNSHGKMPSANKSYSRASIECLDWHAKQLDIIIRHAETRAQTQDSELDVDEMSGEHLLSVPGHRWKADGFSLHDGRKVCWEFHGCVWHGCPTCFPNRTKVLKGRSMQERFEATLARTATIRDEGYIVIEIWECEWYALLEDEEARGLHLNALRLQLDTAPVAFKRRTSHMDEYFQSDTVHGKRIRLDA